MNKLLIHTNGNEAFVLEINGEEAEEAFLAYKNNIERWPDDFGAYSCGLGLFIWEGTIVDSDTFSGTMRELTSKEWATFQETGKVF